ncbi:MAG: hypothetical protein QM650_05730, partial [Microlunatus sp.]
LDDELVCGAGLGPEVAVAAASGSGVGTTGEPESAYAEEGKQSNTAVSPAATRPTPLGGTRWDMRAPGQK